MELYYDILKGILDELVDNESGYGNSKVKPTRVNLGAILHTINLPSILMN